MSGIMQMLIGTGSAGMTPGTAYGGGYYAGQVNISGTKYNIVVSDASVGQTSTSMGTYGTQSPTSTIDGPTNSATCAAAGSSAASFCENLNTGGYTDWYLPAQDELEVVYYFLKPTTFENFTGSGSNAYAVSPEPVSTNYTGGSPASGPAQTSATSFQSGNSQAMGTGYYWTSTGPSGNPFAQTVIRFLNGEATTQNKTFSSPVRAIRRVLA